MKKVLKLSIIALIFIFCLTGCAGSIVSFVNSNADINDVMSSMIKETGDEAGSYSDIPEKFYTEVYGVNKSDYKNVLIKGSTDSLNSNEIILIEAKDEKSADTAKSVLEARVEALKDIWSKILPDQYAKVQSAVIETKKNFAVLIIAPDVEAVYKAFDKAVG